MSVALLDHIIFGTLLLYALCSNVSTAGASIAIVLGFVFSVVRYVRQPIPLYFTGTIGKAILVFMVAILISVLFSQDIVLSFEQFVTYFQRMLPMILAMLFITERKQLVQILLMLSISICIDDAYGLWQRFQHSDPAYRPLGFTNSFTFYAAHLMQMIILFFVMSFKEAEFTLPYRIWFMFITVFSSIMLILNNTRGAWIAVACVMIIYSFMNVKSWKKSLGLVTVIAIIFSVFMMQVPYLKERLYSITDVNYHSNVERILMWKSALNMIKDYPVVGIGPGEFEKFYNEVYISPLAKETGHSSPHNNYLMFLSETGIIGFIGYIYLYGYIVVYFYKSVRRNAQNPWAMAVLLVTLVLLIEGLTDYTFGQASIMRLYWFVVGTGFAAERIMNGYNSTADGKKL